MVGAEILKEMELVIGADFHGYATPDNGWEHIGFRVALW